MNELMLLCQKMREGYTPRIQDPTKPVRYWSEKDVFNGEVVDAYVLILRTRGCAWALHSGCTMCGYGNDSLWKPASEKDLLHQVDTALKQYAGEPVVKIFTSGSFFDTGEIPVNVRNHLFEALSEKTKKISVESRPEYVTKDNLVSMKKVFSSQVCEIGVGLETASDIVRDYAVNKGFTFKQYVKAVEIMKKNRCDLKTYVLVKPPFLTENEALKDTLSTIKAIQDLTTTVSLNPTNVQRNTLVEYLWRRKQFRPAWLWSIVEILRKGKELFGEKRLQCDVVGGGSRQGAHNCGSCDHKVLEAITSFSLHQDTRVFDGLDCACKEQWRDQLEVEPLSFGSIVDFSEKRR
ncbi:MAG: archaeosine biosynthesis radical SAM protein RaSEA [Methanobacteriota archaeon]